jgi:prepilin-type N-terminal cleavage/methylation domain-containing protein
MRADSRTRVRFSGRASLRRSGGLQRGFTLIELLITLAIIGVLVVLSVPILIQQRIQANQANAVAGMKVIFAAQVNYNYSSNPHRFADSLEALGTGADAGNVGFIDEQMASGHKAGYVFTLGAAARGADGLTSHWSAEAHPILYRRLGILSFYVDETGHIRAQDVLGAPGSADMKPADSFN